MFMSWTIERTIECGHIGRVGAENPNWTTDQDF
jgi:hypothetical protein